MQNAFFVVFLLCSFSFAQIDVSRFSSEVQARVGSRAQFQVQASASTPLSYTWYFGGVEQEENSSSFSTSPLSLSENGTEVVLFISDQNGFSRTLNSRLTVLKPTSQTILLEGHLTDRLQNQNLTVDLQVVLFNQQSGGDSLYCESFLSKDSNEVRVSEGKFSVHLGSQDSSLTKVLAQNSELYTEFRVGREGAFETLSPRLSLTALPYSLQTNELKTVDSAGNP